jgi:hypothetical protein
VDIEELCCNHPPQSNAQLGHPWRGEEASACHGFLESIKSEVGRKLQIVRTKTENM